MSLPFLILAGVSCLIMAGTVQTNAGTNTVPLFIYLIYALSGAFFLFAILRAVRILQH